MAASASDKLRKSYSFLQKSLNGNITDSDTTITLNNTTSIPTDTAVDFIIDRVDSNGNRTNSTREIISGVVSGSTIINCTRGLHGTTAQSHTSGAVVEFVASGKAWNDMVDWGLVEHNQDGTHGAVTATSLATNTITEDTAAAGVTIDGLLIKDSKLATNDSVVTTNITNDAVTATKIDWASTGADGGIWWEELGRTTLGVAGDTISVTNIPARAYLRVLVKLIDTGGTIGPSFRFNNDSGSNYALRVAINGAADTTATSQTSFGVGLGNGADPVAGDYQIVNVASEDKLIFGFSVRSNATGAGTAPSKSEGLGKWANTSDQVTRIDVLNLSGTGDYAIGSEVVVLGHN